MISLVCFVLFLTIFTITANAQTTGQSNTGTGSDKLFFICPLFEVLNSRTTAGFGAGFAMGAGDKITMGTRLLFLNDQEDIHSIEISVFMRYYIFRNRTNSGLFAQLNAGAVVFNFDDTVKLPAEIGDISVNLLAGWRFLLGNAWFIDPVIRAGYPYLFGAGVSAGLRF